MQLSQFSEVQVTPARGTLTITAQSELQYASLVALLLSLYLILEAEALSYTRCIRLAWGFLGPFVSVIRFGNFISRVSRTVTGADGAGMEAGVNGADLSGALLFGAFAIIGTWAMDFLAPPQFPPPLFVHPLGLSVRTVKHCLLESHLSVLSAAWLTCVGLVGACGVLQVRGSLVCGALVISTVAFGLVHGFQQADDAVARVRGSLVQSIRLVALLIAAVCVADAGVTASLLASTALLLIWVASVAWAAARQALVACYHRCWRRRRGRRTGGGSDGDASAAELDSDDDEPPSPDGAAGNAARSSPRFSRDFVCANYDPSQDFHARGAELAAAEVAKLMASEEFQERFHGDRLHPSRPVGFLEVCMIS
jgi:hypothetical protein